MWNSDVSDMAEDFRRGYEAGQRLAENGQIGADRVTAYDTELRTHSLTNPRFKAARGPEWRAARDDMLEIMGLVGIRGPQELADATGEDTEECAEFWKSPVGCDPLTRAEVLTGLYQARGEAAMWNEPNGPNGETLGELVYEWECQNFPLPEKYEREATACHVAAGFVNAIYQAEPAAVAALYNADYDGLISTIALDLMSRGLAATPYSADNAEVLSRAVGTSH